MPLFFSRTDITKLQVDAIVNAANKTLLGGGGVDGAIHRAAGPGLLAECRTLGGCETGEAKLTKGHDLPAKYVIHTVGPVWTGGGNGEAALLSSCYRKSLALAKEAGCRSVAFPLISSGAYGYPKREALKIAVSAIREAPETEELDVTLVLFLDRGDLLDPITRLSLERRLIPPEPAYACGAAPPKASGTKRRLLRRTEKPADLHVSREEVFSDAAPSFAMREEKNALPAFRDRLDESFSASLLRLIDERGLTDAEVYKRANLDRRHFSKIRSNPAYRPTKATVLCFAVALRLSSDETRELLSRAGYALSPSLLFDVIVDYYITSGNYDVFEINETLFAYDQPLLGA